MQYIWFIWSLILIPIWLIIYKSLDSDGQRREMLIVSLWTSIIGLAEPFFVPAYWAPPSLFDLALRTGFDIESLIFSFGVGGIVVVLYEKLFHSRHIAMSAREHYLLRHRYHIWAIISTPIVFIALFFATDLNPIYSAIIALVIGGLSAWYCRPDLKKKMIVSGFLFLTFYFIYFLILIAISPGYVERVWNLNAISGILILGIPLEELLYAWSFGFTWSSIYEHITWHRLKE